jgi:hypothetical protein
MAYWDSINREFCDAPSKHYFRTENGLVARCDRHILMVTEGKISFDEFLVEYVLRA